MINVSYSLVFAGFLVFYKWLLDIGKETFGPEKITLMQRIEKHRYEIKNEISDTNEAGTVVRVNECYSSIEIQHFCRDDQYTKDEMIKCPLGFGLFWQKIVPLIIKISSAVGCEFVYLFAADRSDNPDDKKLVSYYKESLYFHELDDEGVTVLKPGYDSNCIGLIQSVSQLQTMREFAWEAFSDVFT